MSLQNRSQYEGLVLPLTFDKILMRALKGPCRFLTKCATPLGATNELVWLAGGGGALTEAWQRASNA